MSRAEQYSWTSLVATGLVFAWFNMQMLDGWTLVDQTPGRLLWIFVALVIATIIAETVVTGVLIGGRRGGEEVLEDERDRQIETKANRNEHWFLVAAVNVLVVQTIAQEAFPGNAFERGYQFLAFDIVSPEGIFFSLFWVLFVGHFIKLASTIVYNRI